MSFVVEMENWEKEVMCFIGLEFEDDYDDEIDEREEEEKREFYLVREV
ncbi:MAG: hypothetical protein PHC56_06655 [Herbinix sp.]|nr:hypothetical protein [Herbinix sp.]